jgi:hypothetical protein
VTGRHGPYTGLPACFAVSVDASTVYREPSPSDPPVPEIAQQDSPSEDHAAVANALCEYPQRLRHRVRSSPHPASTTSPRLLALSRPHCPGWRVGWAHLGVERVAMAGKWPTDDPPR